MSRFPRKPPQAPTPIIRFAQIVTETVHVVCPYCGADQPNEAGEDEWTKEQLRKLDTGQQKCVSCELTIQIMTQPKAQII